MIVPRRFVVVAGVIMDIITVVDSLPPRSGDVLAKEGMITPGGAFNVIAAAQRLGCPTVYAGRLGHGILSTMARQQLDDYGVPIVGEKVMHCDTGFVVAIVEFDGERTFVTASGAESLMTEDHLRSISVRPGDAIYVSGYHMLTEPYASAMAEWILTLPESTVVVWDPGPLISQISGPIRERLMKRADILTVNLKEATVLSGAVSPDEALRQLSGLMAFGARAIVRVGESGAWVMDGAAKPLLIPTRKVRALNTSGAGDVHTGALIARLHHQLTWERSIYEANICASYAVEQATSSASPTQRELEDLLSQF